MIVEILCSFVFIIALLYFWLSWKWTYWTKKGIHQGKTKFPFGTMAPIFTKSMQACDFFCKEAIENENLPYYGGYMIQTPILMIKDANLVRNILVKDFEYFVDRNGSFFNNALKTGQKVDELWSKMLMNASGEEWKNIRSTFVPIFTPGKIKAMLLFMHETCNNLTNAMDKYAENNEPFELKEMLGKYSMDTIASCAFGVDAESFTNSNSKFVQFGRRLFNQYITDGLKVFLALLPGGCKILNALDKSLMPKKETTYLYEAMLSSLNHRKEHNIRRNDLIDLMLDALKGDLVEEINEDEDQFEKVLYILEKKISKKFQPKLLILGCET